MTKFHFKTTPDYGALLLYITAKTDRIAIDMTIANPIEGETLSYKLRSFADAIDRACLEALPSLKFVEQEIGR